MNNIIGLFVVPSLYMLLHLLGLVLAIVFWKRSPAACGLLILAMLLNSLATMARVPLHLLVREGWIPPEFFSVAMSGTSIVSWLGYALTIVAVVVGRTPPSPGRPADSLDSDTEPMPRTPAKSSGHTGIQEY